MTENILNAVQDDAVVQLAYNLVVDGEELESEVLEYLHGHQNIIPGLENARTGL
jgi:FKBP-type peptidyl-prolyl cis-trans isomerase 2